MILRECLKLIKETQKVNLYVDGKEIGIYANPSSVKEETMYQNYVVQELSTKLSSYNSVLVVKVVK